MSRKRESEMNPDRVRSYLWFLRTERNSLQDGVHSLQGLADMGFDWGTLDVEALTIGGRADCEGPLAVV